jgi:hypothetical protein
MNRTSERSTQVAIVFTVYFQHSYILAAYVVRDLNALPPEQLSLLMGYVVEYVRGETQCSGRALMSGTEYTTQQQEEQSRYWIVFVAIGGAILLLALGWLMLCAYFNTYVILPLPLGCTQG